MIVAGKIIVTMLLVLFVSNCGQKPAFQSNEPFLAPNFEGHDFNSGKTLKLANFKGKPVVINFWFAGCPPCRWEAPAFKKFAQDNPDIVVLSVTNPKNNEEGAIQQFITEFGWQNISVILDKSGKITTAFDQDMVFPTTFLINKDGLVVGKIVNYLDWETAEMQDVIQHLRNGKLIWYFRYLQRKK